MASSTRSKLAIPPQPISAQQLFLQVKQELQKSQSLLLEDISADIAAVLVGGLEADKEIGEGYFRYNFDITTRIFSAYVPTYIHDSVQPAFSDILKDMVDARFLSWAQFKILSVFSGTRYEDFVGVHAGSRKEPDAGVLVDGRMINGLPDFCPVWANECAYSDPQTKLNRDIHKWIDGTAGGVVWGVASNFNKRTNSRVSGSVDFFTGMNVVTRSIFPAPPNPNDDRIRYTRDDLFGGVVPLEQGQTAQDVYILDIGLFRRRASTAAQKMGLIPV